MSCFLSLPVWAQGMKPLYQWPSQWDYSGFWDLVRIHPWSWQLGNLEIFFLSEKVTRRNNIRDEKNDHFVIIDSSVGHRYRCMDLRWQSFQRKFRVFYIMIFWWLSLYEKRTEFLNTIFLIFDNWDVLSLLVVFLGLSLSGGRVGFPGGKESYQYRRCKRRRFNPWVERIP